MLWMEVWLKYHSNDKTEQAKIPRKTSDVSRIKFQNLKLRMKI